MTCPLSCERLVLAVSPGALFDLREPGWMLASVGQGKGAPGYPALDELPLRPGRVFTLVRKLLALNTDTHLRVEVILISTDRAADGVQVCRSLDHYRLPISRVAFTCGAPSHRYATAFGAQLFLSTDAHEVRLALDHGLAAATVMAGAASASDDDIVRIAFDGDAVLFSDEAEQVYVRAGLDAFIRSEQQARHVALAPGPLQPFLVQLHRLQTEYERASCQIRTALVTARSVSAHERALRTLRAWRIEVDEVMFLAGRDKGLPLRAFGADLFFDDQQHNCERAAAYVPCAHVPYGIKNRSVYPALQRVA